MNALTETVSFFKRFPEWFKAPSLNPPANQVCGFQNVRIRVDWALFSLVFLQEAALPSGQRVGLAIRRSRPGARFSKVPI